MAYASRPPGPASWGNTAPGSNVTTAPPGSNAPPSAMSTKTSGTASAVSLTQNWNAWTNVMERIPPAATTALTTTAIPTEPTHGGTAATLVMTSAAPWSCGTT
ncbi:Uncharacterised protein [Mycobacteroides abscessus]|nr:Uncharacterised protein [Mycobacteroides abscessus]